MLYIVFKEEPDLLPFQGFGQGVGVTHDSDTNVTIGDATDEVLNPGEFSLTTREGGCAIVSSYAGDQVPVPGGCDVFILIAFEISVVNAIREVEAQWLEISMNKRTGGVGLIGTHVLRIDALGVLGSAREHLDSGNVVPATMNLQSRERRIQEQSEPDTPCNRYYKTYDFLRVSRHWRHFRLQKDSERNR